MKLCVIFHRLGPYHVARLSAAAQRTGLSAVELSLKDRTYAWERVRGPLPFRRITLSRSDGIPPAKQRALLSLALEREAPDAVAIPGWSHPAALSALHWCLRRRVPALLMSESQECDQPRSWWKELLKRRIVAGFSAALVGGLRHAQYLASLGMGPERIYRGYDAVDNGHFAREAALVRRRADDLRMLAGLPRRFFLASSRFVPPKNLKGLLHGYARYRNRAGRRAWPLVLLGDGPQLGELMELRRGLDLRGQLLLPGFVQYKQLPLYYGLASAFVHASSSEPWGLVVNEAMASSLPLLLSRSCGCAPDLLREGINGYGFEPGDEEELARGFARLSSGSEDLQAMGRASLRGVQSCSPDAFAEGLLRAARAALAGGARPGARGLSALAYCRGVLEAA
jgi:glycosyltransferase involved in cell wall biosynthesis